MTVLLIAIAGAVLPSVAAAAPPEFGQCLHMPKGSGEKFKGPACDRAPKPAGTPRRPFEWAPLSSPIPFTASGSASTLQATAPDALSLTCKRESETGNYTGPKTVGGVVMRFTHCESGATPCGNAGAGEIVTSTLEGEIGYKNEQLKRRVLLLLYPAGHTGAFASFTCGATTVVLSGSLLGPVPDDHHKRSYLARYVAHGSEQNAETFEGQSGEVLSASVGGQAPARAGLELTTKITGQEVVEINAFV